MAQAPARNCPYRDADGRLRFSTYQMELFDVLGYPIRRDGKLFIAARSYLPAEYADGWMTNYPIRDNVDDRLFAVQPAGTPIADCWPDTITNIWIGKIGVLASDTLPPYVFDFVDFGVGSTFYTLTKVCFTSTPTAATVVYAKTFTGNYDAGAISGDWYAIFGDDGIDYEVTIYLTFMYKAAGIPATRPFDAIDPSGEYTDAATLIGYSYKCEASAPAAPSYEFWGSSEFLVCDSSYCEFAEEEYNSHASAPDSFVVCGNEIEDPYCATVTEWESSEDGVKVEFSTTCEDLLDYLIDKDFYSRFLMRREDTGSPACYPWAEFGPNFIGASYA